MYLLIKEGHSDQQCPCSPHCQYSLLYKNFFPFWNLSI